MARPETMSSPIVSSVTPISVDRRRERKEASRRNSNVEMESRAGDDGERYLEVSLVSGMETSPRIHPDKSPFYVLDCKKTTTIYSIANPSRNSSSFPSFPLLRSSLQRLSSSLNSLRNRARPSNPSNRKRIR